LASTQPPEILAEIDRRRFELNIGLVRIYNYYRTFVGIALIAAFSQEYFSTQLGNLNPTYFWWVTIAYTGANLVSIVVLSIIPQRWYRGQLIHLSLVFFDISVLTFLMYCSGGIGSGLAPLILVAVVTGAILVTGPRATLVAATATIAGLYEEFYLFISAPDAQYDFFQAGLFGLLYFITSLAVQRLSTRLRQNDIRALTQAAELADLERLNRIIIQRMRTGIIVVDRQNEIRMHNHSARSLIGAANTEGMTRLPTTLEDNLNVWRADTLQRTPAFQVAPQLPAIRVNFSAVRSNENEGDVTIFLEDTGEIQQQAQQLKLAELGRLSASIAHEVRNPLGAISHAAQLLIESEDLEPPDRRLTDIIISHCKRMNGVVENVLEMSRRRNPQPERIGLVDHIGAFIEEFGQSKPDATISLEVDPVETEVRIDPRQLDQVLTNLCDNGMRYSEQNGHGQAVSIVAGIDAVSERPFLNVVDRGIGVADDIIPSLFQPFSTNTHLGTGLGLYISRELCEANQAQLSYFKHEDGGSCFRILFSHPDRITG